MKRAYTNGILLDGTEQMEPVRGKVLLTENDKITAIADAGVSLDGYEVIDLGRDVEYQAVADAAMPDDVKLVGLSALMTTTLKSMGIVDSSFTAQCQM